MNPNDSDNTPSTTQPPVSTIGERWCLRDAIRNIPNDARYFPMVIADGKGNASPVLKIGVVPYANDVMALTLFSSDAIKAEEQGTKPLTMLVRPSSVIQHRADVEAVKAGMNTLGFDASLVDIQDAYAEHCNDIFGMYVHIEQWRDREKVVLSTMAKITSLPVEKAEVAEQAKAE